MTPRRLLVAAAVLLASALPAFAQPSPVVPQPAPAPAAAPPAPRPEYGRVITLAEARTVAAAAEAEAKKNGWQMVITVVEPNGAVVLSMKMDGTQYGSNDVALGKARTASNFRRPTREFADAVKTGNINSLFTGAVAIEGGELLLVDGRIVGAIGVSGGAAKDDGVAARAGAAALK